MSSSSLADCRHIIGGKLGDGISGAGCGCVVSLGAQDLKDSGPEKCQMDLVSSGRLLLSLLSAGRHCEVRVWW